MEERQVNMSIRPMRKLIKAKPTLEGAGVHLRRAFGFGNTSANKHRTLGARALDRRRGCRV